MSVLARVSVAPSSGTSVTWRWSARNCRRGGASPGTQEAGRWCRTVWTRQSADAGECTAALGGCGNRLLGKR